MIVDYTMGAIAHNITTTLNGIPLQNEIFQNGITFKIKYYNLYTLSLQLENNKDRFCILCHI